MVDLKWLTMCAMAGEFLYGDFTTSVLKQMYEKKKGYTVSLDELVASMKELEKAGEVLLTYSPGQLDDTDPAGRGFFTPKDCRGTELEAVLRKADAEGNPYASIHFDPGEELDLFSDLPDDFEFYIPTEKEIVELVEENCIHTAAMTKLEEAVRNKGGNPDYLKALWARISTNKLEQMEAISAVMNGAFPGAVGLSENEEIPESVAAKLPTMDDLNALMPHINEFINCINRRDRKGWRPKDLFKKMHPNGLISMPTLMPGSVQAAKSMKGAEAQLRAMGANVDYSSIDNFTTIGPFGERRVVKVGRNDPCPCGSGLKYKKCHGKGR